LTAGVALLAVLLARVWQQAPAAVAEEQVARQNAADDEAIAAARKAIELDPKDPKAYFALGVALSRKGQLDEAVASYRKAIALDPQFAAAYSNLGHVLHAQHKLDEAVAAYRQAIDLDPKLAPAHNGLGNVLRAKKQWDDAVAEYKKAIELDPRFAPAHTGLGFVLYDKNQVDDAIAEFEKAFELDPKDATAHLNLGVALHAKYRLDDALAEFRKALELDPKNEQAHLGLANVLLDRCRVDEALHEFRVLLELASPALVDPHIGVVKVLILKQKFADAKKASEHVLKLLTVNDRLRPAVARQVETCERLQALEPGLADLLAGKEEPKDSRDRLALGELCRLQRRFVAAARFYDKALADDAKQADDLEAAYRFHAACAGALAGCGHGEDASKLDDKERGRLRRQALAWLKADLALWTKRADKDDAKARAAVAEGLKQWHTAGYLSGVREKDALDKLPAGEAKDWRQLWDDVANLLKKAGDAK
jgi:tetratricopeptide (TPR) repeat protein